MSKDFSTHFFVLSSQNSCQRFWLKFALIEYSFPKIKLYSLNIHKYEAILAIFKPNQNNIPYTNIVINFCYKSICFAELIITTSATALINGISFFNSLSCLNGVYLFFSLSLLCTIAFLIE